MSSYIDPILTKQGYRSLGTNSDFFMNLSVDTPTKGNLLMFDGLNWKPTATENITFGTLIFDGGNASGLGHAYLSVI